MPRRRKKAPGFEHWLGTTALPVYVLDAERRIVAFNAGCEALTGWQAAEVLGVICRYTSASDLAGPPALAASLCPPPDASASEMLAAPAYVLHKDGRVLPRLLQFVRLHDEKGRASGTIGIALPLPQGLPPADVSSAQRLHAELAAVRSSLRARFATQGLVGACPAFRRVLAQLDVARHTTAAVLLQGEAGTGKEHLARAIHFESSLRDGWFIPLDCRRLGPDELQRVWQRVFEPPVQRGTTADDQPPGTLYLADVDFLPADMQKSLVAQCAKIESQPAGRAFRLIASIAGSIQAAVHERRLHADVLWRLSTLTIEAPPLRERGDDLRLLAQHFLEETNRLEPSQAAGFDEAVWPLFRRYEWPGNLDELLAVVGEARRRSTAALIRVDDLPFRFRNALEAQLLPPLPPPPALELDRLLERVERRLIELALARAKHNKSKAAQILAVARGRLLRRIEQLGLENGQPAETLPPSLVELSAELLEDETPDEP